jgi:hypothetical protein
MSKRTLWASEKFAAKPRLARDEVVEESQNSRDGFRHS